MKYLCQIIMYENGRFQGAQREMVAQLLKKNRKSGRDCGHMNKVTGANLRVRGKGSGFKEGPRNQESTDELMLTISHTDKARFLQCFDMAMDIVVHTLRSCKQDPEIWVHVGPRPGAY